MCFANESPLPKVTTVPRLMFIGLMKLEIYITFLFYHVISREHTIKRTFNLVNWESLNLSYHDTKFDAYRSYGSGDITLLFCHVKSRGHMIKERRDLVNGKSSN